MYWLILLIPLFTAWIAKFVLHKTITWKEMGVQMLISGLVVSVVLLAGTMSKSWDTEVWNGRVLDKKRVEVSCSHSYSCPPCYPVYDSKGNKIGENCSTCYDHDYDVDWRVYTSLDWTVYIDRIDRQGVKEPPRWTQVKIGEPVSKETSFVNYIKAVPESIFNDGGTLTCSDELTNMVPPYPRVYDYYRIQRVQTVGVSVEDLNKWNDGLNEIAKELGASYEVNPLIQFVKTDDPTYEFALEKKWLKGKKNDVIVVFGVKEYPNIDFVRVVGWENERIKHYLREQLSVFDTINDEYREYALSTIKQNIVLNYKRMKMQDYEYLKDQIEPPTWVIVTGFILAIVLSVGLTMYFHRVDAFGDEGFSLGRRGPLSSYRRVGRSRPSGSYRRR